MHERLSVLSFCASEWELEFGFSAGKPLSESLVDVRLGLQRSVP